MDEVGVPGVTYVGAVVDPGRTAYPRGIRPVAWLFLAVFAASVVIGVIYLTNDPPRHGGAFIALGVVAAVGLYRTSTHPASRR